MLTHYDLSIHREYTAGDNGWAPSLFRNPSR